MIEMISARASPHRVGDELVSRLRSIYCDPSVKRLWSAYLPRGDPRMTECLSVLAEAGLTPWTEHWRSPTNKEFTMEIQFEYTKADIARAQYLIMGGVCAFECVGVSPTGLCRLRPGPCWNKADRVACESLVPSLLFVPDLLQRELAGAGLRGLEFRPTVEANDSSSDYAAPKWWELTSTVRLPPMSPAVVLVDALTGERYDEITSKSCAIDEGLEALCRTPRIRYRRSDLGSLDQWDIGCTHERLGIGTSRVRDDRYRVVIVSQRLRQWCVAHRVRASFSPVFLED